MPDCPRLCQSSLHWAAFVGDLVTLAALLAAGADIDDTLDVVDGYGYFYHGITPLMLAACSHRGATVETVRWLLDHGADINVKSAGKVTAAWYAAGHGLILDPVEDIVCSDQSERLRVLLLKGADPNETADNGRSLLVEACRGGDPMRVSLLLEYGAVVSPNSSAIAPHYRRTRSRRSLSHDDGIDKAQANAFVPSINGQFSSYQIPLFCAVRSGSVDCVQRLIQAGADVNLWDNSGYTPLMYARNLAMVTLLIQSGVDINLISDYGDDAFQRLVSLELEDDEQPEQEDILQALALLIRHGADVNATNHHGWTRLFRAAFDSNSYAIERLLTLGADLSLVHQPLLSALAWHCNGEFDGEMARAIDILVAVGEDVNAQDPAGDTLLHNATLDYDYSSNAEYFCSSSDGCNYTAVCCFLRYGADPDPVGTHGRTPLMLATAAGSLATILVLVAAGADPTRRDDSGQTALDIAWQRYETCEAQSANYVDETPQKQQAYRHTLQAKATCLRFLQCPMALLPPTIQLKEP